MKDPQALEEFIKLSDQRKKIKWRLNKKTDLYRLDEDVEVIQMIMTIFLLRCSREESFQVRI